jgi:hypothetical protein
MNVKVVTTYNNELYDKYANLFVSTYNWPFELIIYNEDKDFFKKVPECEEFTNRHKNKVIKNKYGINFRYDAVRFCYKVFAFTHAILNENADGLICMDADAVFYKNIDEKFVRENIHKEDCMMTYFGRDFYSECGFLYFNINHPNVKDYAREMIRMYMSDDIYKEEQQQDCWIWDLVRRKFEKDYGVKNYNLSPNGTFGEHVQAKSILSKYYDHLKGQHAKAVKKSQENKSI